MWDGNGPEPRKPPPEGFRVNAGDFVRAIEWVKSFVYRVYGEFIGSVVHDAYPNLWRFYDADGDLILVLEHKMMSRIVLVLEQIDWLWEAKQLDYDDDVIDGVLEEKGDYDSEDGA